MMAMGQCRHPSGQVWGDAVGPEIDIIVAEVLTYWNTANM